MTGRFTVILETLIFKVSKYFHAFLMVFTAEVRENSISPSATRPRQEKQLSDNTIPEQPVSMIAWN